MSKPRPKEDIVDQLNCTLDDGTVRTCKVFLDPPAAKIRKAWLEFEGPNKDEPTNKSFRADEIPSLIVAIAKALVKAQ